jgi:aerobic-type carbon monoxide dehydrogenase small subunit (CoxS/CutS family)
MKTQITVNGILQELELQPNETLLNVLRNNGFTEVKSGCQEGECGACLVLLDEKPVNSCQVLAMSVRQKAIRTVKGIGTLHAPHIIQKAFAERGADQCGFCSPGMVISAYSLLQRNPHPTWEEISEALDGNLCRCTGYVKIIEAVQYAADMLRKNTASGGKHV